MLSNSKRCDSDWRNFLDRRSTVVPCCHTVLLGSRWEIVWIRGDSPRQLTLIGHVIVWFLMRYAFRDVRLGLFRKVPSSFFHTYVIAVCSYDTGEQEERQSTSVNDIKSSARGIWVGAICSYTGCITFKGTIISFSVHF